ncbi:AraC family transcriptional regulator [Rhizobium sp. KVB221]|uniref:AraC family transcriptional regulator n=1 Tax=Rhizobium setariae TaxID=2801340 RepID=A0A936YSF0_9HYPH|nr:AraC family transcriptional regulator [Rhizobium setariae]MBL0374913.1 AraC family transcriptional regulator [Rhizobium setariae]
MLSDLIARGPMMRSVSLPRARHPLHVMPTSAGYERREGPGYDWDGLKRGQTPFTIFQFTLAGQGNLAYEGRRLSVSTGEAMILTVPHRHRYWLDQGQGWEFFWISMSGAEAIRIHALISTAVGPVFRPKPQSIDRLADLCLRLEGEAGDSAPRASALAYEAVMVLFADVFGTDVSEQPMAPELSRVIAHVASHLAEKLDIDAMAAVAGLSRAHFSRRFAAAVGLPPAEYVLQEKMRRAARLLVGAGSMPVKQIAAEVGFDDPNYFGKAFRRVFGVSPGEFRSSGMYFDPAAPDIGR